MAGRSIHAVSLSGLLVTTPHTYALDYALCCFTTSREEDIRLLLRDDGAYANATDKRWSNGTELGRPIEEKEVRRHDGYDVLDCFLQC